VQIRLLLEGTRNSNVPHLRCRIRALRSTVLLPDIRPDPDGIQCSAIAVWSSHQVAFCVITMPLIGLLGQQGPAPTSYDCRPVIGGRSVPSRWLPSASRSIFGYIVLAPMCTVKPRWVFLFIPLNAAAYHFLAREEFDHAAASINLARNIGGSFGISFVATVLARRSQFHQTCCHHVSGMTRNISRCSRMPGRAHSAGIGRL